MATSRCSRQGLAALAALVLSLPAAGTVGAEARLSPADLRVHPAIRDGSLALFPLSLTGSPVVEAGFVLLDEGLADGSVVITETGTSEEEQATNAEARPHAQTEQVQQAQVEQNQQVQVALPGARVNSLALRNDSGLPLLLLAGEMIRGARQDRIIAHDVVIPARTSINDLDVFCVESGRWAPQSTEFRSAKAMSGATIRATAQLAKDQSAVWHEVSKYNEAVGAMSDSESLNAAYDKPEVQARIAAAQARIGAELAGIPGACGAVVAVGGRIAVADIFASADLFRRLSGKLLTGYLMDAVAAEPVDAPPPSIDEARAYLAALLGAPRTEDWRGGELVVWQIQTAEVRGATSSWGGAEVHVNGY